MRPWFAALSLAVAAPAVAHDTWLLPKSPRLQIGQTVALELTSAMRFPEPETPVRAERLVASRMRLAGTTRELRARTEPRFLRLSAALDKPGVAAAWVETRPRTLDLEPDQVAGYLEEVGAADTVGAEWKRSGGKVWRETYVKIAKAYVRVGEPGEERSWAEPLGLALEMLPGRDPTRLSVGDTLPLRVLWAGKPIAGLAVGAVTGGSSPASLQKTDANGEVSVVLDRPGPWLVRATWIRASGDGRWNSHFTTLTLEVGPPELQQKPAAVVAALHAALASGDRSGALALLSPELVVLEEGDAETSRDAYASEHLAADMEFGRSTTVRVLDERSGESGDVAWVLRQTETTGSYGGKPVANRDTSTFLLRRTPEGWRITHIHWSSRSLKR